MPDLLEHMAVIHPTLTVKNGVLGHKSDIETTTMLQYRENVCKTYSNGTFRYGPLHQISLVGTVHEEVGGFFPDLLQMLEENIFLKMVRKRVKLKKYPPKILYNFFTKFIIIFF